MSLFSGAQQDWNIKAILLKNVQRLIQVRHRGSSCFFLIFLCLMLSLSTSLFLTFTVLFFVGLCPLFSCGLLFFFPTSAEHEHM